MLSAPGSNITVDKTACMCVSVDSSHESCSYHIQKYSRKFNEIQRPFLFYMNLRVVFGGSTYIRENTVRDLDTPQNECMNATSGLRLYAVLRVELQQRNSGARSHAIRNPSVSHVTTDTNSTSGVRSYPKCKLM